MKKQKENHLEVRRVMYRSVQTVDVAIVVLDVDENDVVDSVEDDIMNDMMLCFKLSLSWSI